MVPTRATVRGSSSLVRQENRSADGMLVSLSAAPVMRLMGAAAAHCPRLAALVDRASEPEMATVKEPWPQAYRT